MGYTGHKATIKTNLCELCESIVGHIFFPYLGNEWTPDFDKLNLIEGT